MTYKLNIEILPQTQISPELDEKIDYLDHLAFTSEGDHDDPEFDAIQWSSHDWMALGWLGDTLVSQLCLIDREILVGGVPLRITGIVLQKVEVRTLPVILTQFNSTHTGQGALVMAATVMIIMLILIVFMFYQRWIVQGFTMSGFKYQITTRK